MISYSDIEDAYRVVRPVVHKTPVLTSQTFNNLCGNTVFLKTENFQRIGAFKIRGAYNKLASLSVDERRRGVIAHSSGNHAQGVALSSALLGIQVTVVMPHTSSKIKVEAARSYGARIVFCEDSSDDRERVAKSFQDTYGYTLVHPYDDDKIIAGQGTIAIELGDQLEGLEYIFVPVGGGGLISGIAIGIKQLFPKCKIIGVETETANDCCQSFQRKQIIRIAQPTTIADGMRTQSIGERNFEIILKYIDDMITVSDEQVLSMMKFFFQFMKIVVEPTGAVAPAAIYHNILKLSGKKVCAIISGGNVDPAFMKQWF